MSRPMFGYIRPDGKAILHIYYDGYKMPSGHGYHAMSVCQRSWENKDGHNTYTHLKADDPIVDRMRICKQCERGI